MQLRKVSTFIAQTYFPPDRCHQTACNQFEATPDVGVFHTDTKTHRHMSTLSISG